MRDLDCITDRDCGAHLLHPLRVRILRLAHEPVSASELAPRLGLSRQRVNYHVRQLARSGLLRRSGRRRRRALVEQLYTASARGYVLSHEILGQAGADWRRVGDTASGEYLLALSGQMVSDLARASRQAEGKGQALAAFSFKSQFRLATQEQYLAFTRALRAAVSEAIARHTSAYLRPDGSDASGQPYRLVLGSYPYVPEPEPASSPEGG